MVLVHVDGWQRRRFDIGIYTFDSKTYWVWTTIYIFDGKFRVLTKNSIFDGKVLVLTKISIFGGKVGVLTKISIFDGTVRVLTKISIFDGKLRVSTKISFFDGKLRVLFSRFSRKMSSFDKHGEFKKISSFGKKNRVLTKMSSLNFFFEFW